MAGTHHSHIRHGDSSLPDAARDALIAAGEQWTEMRAAVFAVLASYRSPASAYDVAERVGQAVGRRVAPNTVYRILDLFVLHNLALRVESRNAYVANDHPGCIHDCIFLICDKCGAAAHIDDDAISKSVRKAASRDGFMTERPIIEVRGRCRECIDA